VLVYELDYRTEALDSKASAVKICFSCVLYSLVHMTQVGVWVSECHTANIKPLPTQVCTCLCYVNVIRSVSVESLCAGGVSLSTFLSV